MECENINYLDELRKKILSLLLNNLLEVIDFKSIGIRKTENYMQSTRAIRTLEEMSSWAKIRYRKLSAHVRHEVAKLYCTTLAIMSISFKVVYGFINLLKVLLQQIANTRLTDGIIKSIWHLMWPFFIHEFEHILPKLLIILSIHLQAQTLCAVIN